MGKCKCHRNVRIQQIDDNTTKKSGKMCQWCIEEAGAAEQVAIEKEKLDKILEDTNKKKTVKFETTESGSEVETPDPVYPKPTYQGTKRPVYDGPKPKDKE